MLAEKLAQLIVSHILVLPWSVCMNLAGACSFGKFLYVRVGSMQVISWEGKLATIFVIKLAPSSYSTVN